ncbi:MAG: NAD(+)/NADH kinase [Candidatus Aenigmarchaeota archaeon]|nr:NAD(+)/NADH kinase [Candidatus Aenigmarchaeota archaeon]
MKVALFGLIEKDKSKETLVKKTAKKYGLEITRKDPEVGICTKGDGTILYAEEKFPTLPKLTLRSKNHVGYKCTYDISRIDELFSKISQKKYTLKKHIKIKCIFNDKEINALNEFQIHNIVTTKALRFSINVKQKNKILFDEKNIIGDGCIFSTPFGSSAYFSSVGGKTFEKGLGLALNNPYNMDKKAFYFDEDVVFEFILNRSPAYLLHDNNPKTITIKENQKITLMKSEEYFNEIHINA